MSNLSEQLSPSLGEAIRKVEDRAQNISARQIPKDLKEALYTYNKQLNVLGADSASGRKTLLDTFSKTEDILTVTSGQQVGIFLSPLLALYKALSAVQLAKHLSKKSGRTVLPVFWLQGEDHDFEEISQITLPFGKNSEVSPRTEKLKYSTIAYGQRVPISELLISEEISQLRKNLLGNIEETKYRKDLDELLQFHYSPGKTFVDAFAGLLADILGKEQLLFLNPRAFPLASFAGNIFTSCLEDLDSLESLLTKEEKSTNSQVDIRKGSPLFFFQPQGKKGERYRLLRHTNQSSQFLIEKTQQEFSSAELLEKIQTSPESFSTSALLRPLVQDSILPNIAYIAGPAEQRYLEQIRPLYAHLKIEASEVIARPKLTLLEPKVVKYLEKENLTLDKISASKEETTKLLAEKNLLALSSKAVPPKKVEAELKEQLLRMNEQLDRLFPQEEDSKLSASGKHTQKQISKSADQARNSVQYHFDKLNRRYQQAIANSDRVSLRRFEYIRSLVLPEGKPQERAFPAVYYFNLYGPAWVEQIKSAIDSHWLESIEHFTLKL